jgi:TonB family protein
MSARRWAECYTRSTQDRSSAAISIVTHVLLIAAAVAATNRPADLVLDWIANRPYYLPPPNRRPNQEESREAIQYVELSPVGVGSGFGRRGAGNNLLVKEMSPGLGDLGRDLTSSIESPKLTGDDSVFTQLEVDSVVARYPGSAAPQYPSDLVKDGIQGSVLVQFVVDTTGFADSSSLRIIRATHEDFARAVRAALPYMRFFPAKVGPKKVRQLVEQEFTFKIEQAATTPARPSGRPRRVDDSSSVTSSDATPSTR